MGGHYYTLTHAQAHSHVHRYTYWVGPDWIGVGLGWIGRELDLDRTVRETEWTDGPVPN
jgi:hypothetical protein